jgi:two-component system nitrate/nitrite response regulator NarL
MREITNGLAMRTSIVRVLVVDDSRPWQKFIRTQLEIYPGAFIVSMESSGFEAVKKAAEMQPDLVLLDIHLSTLSGIEVAQQIRMVAPQSAILFVSGESDLDYVQDAFRAGGHGYVLKQEVAMDLLMGIETVLLGKRFMSPSLGDIDELT